MKPLPKQICIPTPQSLSRRCAGSAIRKPAQPPAHTAITRHEPLVWNLALLHDKSKLYLTLAKKKTTGERRRGERTNPVTPSPHRIDPSVHLTSLSTPRHPPSAPTSPTSGFQERSQPKPQPKPQPSALPPRGRRRQDLPQGVPGLQHGRSRVGLHVPARLQQVDERRRPAGVERGAEPPLNHVPVVVGLGHVGEGLAQGADLPQDEGEGVDVDLLVVRHSRADLGGHEPLAARHAGHLLFVRLFVCLFVVIVVLFFVVVVVSVGWRPMDVVVDVDVEWRGCWLVGRKRWNGTSATQKARRGSGREDRRGHYTKRDDHKRRQGEAADITGI